MNQAQAYHFIGLDVHKQSVVFCEKTLMGQTVGQGRVAAHRRDLVAFAQSRARPWVGGLEATLFSGWIYDVLEPFAVALHVGHPVRLKALTKNKSDRIDAEMLANLLREVHDKALNKPGGNRNRATLEVARKLAAYLLAVDKSGNVFVTPEC